MSDDDNMPPGFRFYPREEELISFYLQQKLQGRRQQDFDCVIPVLYIYDYNPWDLPQLAGERCRSDSQSEEWFFFIPRQERQARGGRPNRLTTTGYWKATGSPGWVYSSSDNRIIGIKRTMVFYNGRPRSRNGPSKTNWKMNEYIAVDPSSNPSLSSTPCAEYTICRVYKRSKCLRSFDRRPLVAAPTLMPTTSLSQPSYNHQQSSSSYHQNQPPRSTIERVSSGEGLSSSGGHANHHIIGPTNNMDIEMSQGPLWEWDAFIFSL